MSIECRVKELLKIKDENGKYTRTTREVSSYLSVTPDAVRASRRATVKHVDRLDKIMAYDMAMFALDGLSEEGKMVIEGSKEQLLGAMARVMEYGSNYSISINKEAEK